MHFNPNLMRKTYKNIYNDYLCKTDNLEIKSFTISSLNEMKYPQNDFHKDVRSESFFSWKSNVTVHEI